MDGLLNEINTAVCEGNHSSMEGNAAVSPGVLKSTKGGDRWELCEFTRVILLTTTRPTRNNLPSTGCSRLLLCGGLDVFPTGLGDLLDLL